MEAPVEGSVTPGGAPGGYSHAALIQKGKEKEKELLDRLKEFFVEKGQPLEDGWRVEVKIRTTGTSLGTTDAYYFSPAGKRYRSRMEIARDLGVVDDSDKKSGGGGKARKKGEAAAGGAPPPPLPRPAAIAEALRRRADLKLPATLACGVTVTSLGDLHARNPAYCTADRLWPAGLTTQWEDEKGVRFINSVTETPSGPMFRIKAQRLASGDRPATEVVELGAGPTPDAAYKEAEERQGEALEIALLNRSTKGRSDPDASPGAALRPLDAAEHLLVRCRPLGQQWGLERFGLADPLVLQAIEGLPGADQVPGYMFVDERPGGWVSEARRLNAELAARGKTQVPVEARRMSGEGSGPPRKRPPRPSRKEAEENAVRRVMDAVIKSIEMEEMKTYTAEQKLRMKLERQLEQDRKRASRENLTEAQLAARLQQRLQQKAAYIEAQRRQAELKATVEDSELPNAEEPPPHPGCVAGGRLPVQHQAVLLEAWLFVNRFGVPLLRMAEGEHLPTLHQLEVALLGEAPVQELPLGLQLPLSPTAGGGGDARADGDGEAAPPPPDAAVRLMMALLDFLVAGLFQETAQAIMGANSDVTMADLRGPGKHSLHPLPLKPDTWQEVARRYLTVLATSAMTQAKDGSAAGMSPPLAVMDPWIVLQYLTAGPPASLTQGAAALPRGASKTAGHSLMARADAAAVAAAERAFTEACSDGDGRAAPRSEQEVQQEQRLLRCMLKEVISACKLKKVDARVLCYGGQAAAAAAKLGRPLDLKCVAARIDAGVYTLLPRPLEAFVADIKYLASLYQGACNKAHSLFAQEYLDRQAPELAACAVSKAEGALREVAVTGVADYLAQHAPPPRQRRPAPETAAPAAAPAEGGGTPPPQSERQGSAEPPSAEAAAAVEEAQQGAQLVLRQATDAVRDLDRPYAPFKEQGSWRGCVVCWSDDDPVRLLPCDSCDLLTHSYCLEPPLEELPLQTEPFLCQRCRKLAGSGAQSGGKPLTPDFARASGGEAIWRLARLLATQDYSEWGTEERCALLRTLCSLCAESAALHDTLHGEEDEVKDKRKEIVQLRGEVKRIQAELAAAQQQQTPGGPDDGAGAAAGVAAAPSGSPAGPAPQRQSRRGGRDPAAELEGMVERISKLEHDISQVGPVRLDPVGLDRHYNRYWLLPAAAAAAEPSLALAGAPPVLVVERHSLDSLAPPGVAAAAAALASRDAVGGGGNDAVAPPPGSAPVGWQVGLYSSILHLQQLAQWLNPKGTREKPLAEEVSRLLDAHQQFAMAHGTPLRPLLEPPPPPEPGALRSAGLDRLRVALLTFEEGNQAATYDDVAGSDARRQRWRGMTGAADTPQALMAALLVLEGMIRPEYLKPYWRPFAAPAPHPADTGTLAAVWLRLEALKAAVKLKLSLNLRALKDVMGGGALLPGGSGTRYSLREPKPLVKRSYFEGPASRNHSDSEGDDPRETRAERAAKRSRQRASAAGTPVPDARGADVAADDEALARELDAELNASGRRTRARAPGGRNPYQQPRVADEEGDWDDDDEDEDDPDADMDDAAASDD